MNHQNAPETNDLPCYAASLLWAARFLGICLDAYTMYQPLAAPMLSSVYHRLVQQGVGFLLYPSLTLLGTATPQTSIMLNTVCIVLDILLSVEGSHLFLQGLSTPTSSHSLEINVNKSTWPSQDLADRLIIIIFFGCVTILIFTPRAHARARGYVIGRGVHILSGLFLEPIFYLQKYSL